MTLKYRPIDQWPGERTERPIPSPFAADWKSTMDLLDRELRMLNASNPVLQIDVAEPDFRLDGELRANAKRRSPAIILAFDSKHGPLKYSCDRYNDWHDNVRAVALALEALRKVDRYGVGQRGEQYTGWKALGAGIPLGAARMTRTEAAQMLVEFAVDDEGLHLFTTAAVDSGRGPGPRLAEAFRAAIKQLHPDSGGVDDIARKLVEARDILQETT